MVEKKFGTSSSKAINDMFHSMKEMDYVRLEFQNPLGRIGQRMH